MLSILSRTFLVTFACLNVYIHQMHLMVIPDNFNCERGKKRVDWQYSAYTSIQHNSKTGLTFSNSYKMHILQPPVFSENFRCNSGLPLIIPLDLHLLQFKKYFGWTFGHHFHQHGSKPTSGNTYYVFSSNLKNISCQLQLTPEVSPTNLSAFPVKFWSSHLETESDHWRLKYLVYML